MRFSWVLSFMFGVFLTTFGYILLLLHRGCSCAFGQEPTLVEVSIALKALAIPLSTWVVGAVVSIIKDKY